MIRRLLWILGTLLLLLVVATGVLLYTGWGLNQALRLADRFAPLEIDFQAAEGRLADRMSFRGLVLADTGWRLEIDRLELDWSPRALLDRQVVIHRLDAGTAEVVLTPGENESPGTDAPPPLDFGWDLAVESAAVDRLLIRDGEGPIVASDLRLVAQLNAGVLSVEQAAGSYDDYRAMLSGRVDSTESYRHDLEIRLEQDGQLARLTAQGDLEATELAIQSEPYGVNARGRLEQLVGDLSWALEAEIDRPEPWPELADTHINARGNLRQAHVESLEGRYADTAFVIADAQFSWEDALRVSAARVELPDQQLIAAVDAHRLETGEISADVDFQMTSQDRQLAGNLEATGTVDDYHATGSGTLDERVRWSLDARGDTEGLHEFQARVAEDQAGSASLTGSATWSPDIQWQTRFEADQLNPARFWPDWPGTLDLTGEARGTDQRAEVEISQISGRMRDHPVSGTAAAVVQTDGVRDLELDVTSGDSRVMASGDWTKEVQALTADFRITALGDFVPDARGALEGRIDADAGAVALDVSGTDLAYGDQYRAGTLEAQGRVAIDPTATSDLSVEASGLTLSGIDVETATATVSGPNQELAIALDADVERLGALETRLTAVMDGERYDVRVSSLSVSSEEYGSWALSDPAQVSVGPETMQVERSCLQSETGTFCALADIGKSEPGRVLIDLDSVTASLFDLPASAAAGEPIRLGGRIEGSIEVRTDGYEIARFDGRIEGERLSVLLLRRAPKDALLFSTLQLAAQGDGERIDARLSADTEGAELQADLTLVDAAGEDPRIADGQLRLDVPRLSQFDPIVQRLSDLDGRLTATVQFAGPLARPDVEGRLQADALTFRWPEYGTAIEGGTLDARLSPAGELDLEANLPTAEGALKVSGDGQLDGIAIQRLKATIQGTRVVMANAPDLEIRASPDLTLTATADSLQLRGTVRIDEAEIERAMADAAVRPSADVVLIGEERQSEAGALQPVDIEIEIILGDKVEFRGFGLDAEIDGRITIIDRPGQRQRARGELLLSGSYKAYGQNLTIENGRLIYSGTPLDNPGVRLEAYREVDNVRAGVRVSGRAANPTIELYSDPSMSDSNILAYMMLGRPLDEATEGESNYLSNAALVLAMKQGSDTTAAIGEQLGFEQFGLTMQEDLGGAAFAVGRYLAPNLYLRYSIGLLNPIDLIELTYELSEHWSLETEIGLETRAGVRYRIERGKPKLEPKGSAAGDRKSEEDEP